MSKQDSYEELINQSPALSMDPASDEITYKAECNRLIKHVYLYLTASRPNGEIDGLEVTETVLECIRYYKPEKGLFLNYFLRSYKQNHHISKTQEDLADRSGGLHLSRGERMASGKIYNYLKHHPGVREEELILLLDQYADVLGMTAEELKHALSVYKACQVESGDAPVGDEDSAGTRFDTIRDEGADFVEGFIAGDQAKRILDILEEVYRKANKGSQELLAIKLTNAIAADQQEELEEYVRSKSFFHEKTWLYVSASGTALKNKQISQITGRSEANVTQIWKRFEAKLRVSLEESL